jgi:hypothetical protein
MKTQEKHPEPFTWNSISSEDVTSREDLTKLDQRAQEMAQTLVTRDLLVRTKSLCAFIRDNLHDKGFIQATLAALPFRCLDALMQHVPLPDTQDIPWQALLTQEVQNACIKRCELLVRRTRLQEAQSLKKQWEMAKSDQTKKVAKPVITEFPPYYDHRVSTTSSSTPSSPRPSIMGLLPVFDHRSRGRMFLTFKPRGLQPDELEHVHILSHSENLPNMMEKIDQLRLKDLQHKIVQREEKYSANGKIIADIDQKENATPGELAKKLRLQKTNHILKKIMDDFLKEIDDDDRYALDDLKRRYDLHDDQVKNDFAVRKIDKDADSDQADGSKDQEAGEEEDDSKEADEEEEDDSKEADEEEDKADEEEDDSKQDEADEKEDDLFLPPDDDYLLPLEEEADEKEDEKNDPKLDEKDDADKKENSSKSVSPQFTFKRFVRNFNAFCGIQHPSELGLCGSLQSGHVMVMGGSVLAALLPLPPEFEQMHQQVDQWDHCLPWGVEISEKILDFAGDRHAARKKLNHHLGRYYRHVCMFKLGDVDLFVSNPSRTSDYEQGLPSTQALGFFRLID